MPVYHVKSQLSYRACPLGRLMPLLEFPNCRFSVLRAVGQLWSVTPKLSTAFFASQLRFWKRWDIRSESLSVVLLWIWSRNCSISLGYSISLPVNLKSWRGGKRCCSCARSRAIPESVSELLIFTVKTVSWRSSSLSMNASTGSPTGSTWAGRCRGFDLTSLDWGGDVPLGLGIHNGVLLEQGWFNGLLNFGWPGEQAWKLVLTEGDALTYVGLNTEGMRNLATPFFWTLHFRFCWPRNWPDWTCIHYCIQWIAGASAHNDMTMLCLIEDLTLTQQGWL